QLRRRLAAREQARARVGDPLREGARALREGPAEGGAGLGHSRPLGLSARPLRLALPQLVLELLEQAAAEPLPPQVELDQFLPLALLGAPQRGRLRVEALGLHREL